jgi:hypothetical protein
MNIENTMYNDMRDKPIDLKQIFQEFPALDQAIGPLILTTLQASINRNDEHAFYKLLETIKGVSEWRDTTKPLAVKLIPTTLRTQIDWTHNVRDLCFLARLLQFIKSVSEWKDEATPLAVELIPAALQILNGSSGYVFCRLLKSINGVPEWNHAAWAGFGRNASPETQAIMIDILGPMPDFGTLAPATAEALTHS